MTTTTKAMPVTVRDKCFKLRCQSKQGATLNAKDQQFVKKCFDDYKDEYIEMTKEVFEKTKPFGAAK